jgi:hypothetical protein
VCLRGPIFQSLNALVLRAVSAAEDFAGRFDAVADDPASAMVTARCESMDGAFEAIERHGLAAVAYMQGFVVVVSADITSGHSLLLGLPFQKA